jgi:hypothetical protein
MKMKNNNIKIVFFILVFATSLMSCKKLKDFGNTNVNPANITTPATYAILTGVETGISGWATDGNATVWIQYASETQYPGIGLYAVPQFGMGSYTGALLNLKTIIDAKSSDDEVAVARILTQYIYWHITDALGDIPYSEALKGVVPKYDRQEDIYAGMIAELKAANAQFKNNGALKGDILNNNNVGKWKKFANSLRAMMALQLSKAASTKVNAANEFKAAITDGVIELNADNIQLNFPGGDYKNPYYLANFSARDNGESVFLYNMLSGLSDGRQAAFGSSDVAVIYGVKEATINQWIKDHINWSRFLAPSKRLETSPVFMLTASELYLARAEAAERGWTAEDKTLMLTTGVNRSFEQWGLAAPSASYFTQPGVILDGTNNLKKIAEQAYLASFPNGRLAWNIWRRTGYPVLTPSPDPLNAAHVTIPRRYTFALGGSSEYSLNPEGVASGIATLSPATDLQESKIWWDK